MVSLAPGDPLIAEQLQVVGGQRQVRPRLLSQQSQGPQPEAGRGFEGRDGLQEEREGGLGQRVVSEGVRVSELGGAQSFCRVQQSLLAVGEPGLAGEGGGEEALERVGGLQIWRSWSGDPCHGSGLRLGGISLLGLVLVLDLGGPVKTQKNPAAVILHSVVVLLKMVQQK